MGVFELRKAKPVAIHSVPATQPVVKATLAATRRWLPERKLQQEGYVARGSEGIRTPFGRYFQQA